MRVFSLSAMLLTVAAQAQAQSDAISRDAIGRVVASIANQVESNYIVPDTGRMIADYLRRQLSAGAYDKLQTRAQFTDRATADLRFLNGDPHLNVRTAATTGGAGTGPQMVRRGPGGPVISPEALEAARRSNFGVRRAERLSGNVGYLDLAVISRSGTNEAYKAIDAAMAMLEWVDAMIIDVRNTPGGEPAMSDYIASYFLGDSIRTMTTSMAGAAMVMERTTVPVTGRRRTAVPVYVLIGPGTVSGAEDLAFIFKTTGRATLVGDRSAGAGRPNRFYPVDEGFMVSVSIGRTFDPRSGKEWERVGIEPDISAPGGFALAAAHVDALKRLAAATQDSARRRSLDFARENVQARWRPHVPAPKLLAELAGEYDARRVSFEGGKLFYTRAGGRSRDELTPTSDSTFALGEATRVEFVRDGSKVVSMRFLTPDGQIAVVPKTR
jgi:hypothetical protein